MQNRITWKLVLVGLIATVGFACGNNGDNNSTPGNLKSNLQARSTVSGTWGSDCKTAKFAGLLSEKEEYSFGSEGSTFNRKTTYFADATCSDGVGALYIMESGNVSYQGSSNKISGGVKVTFTFNKVVAKPLADAIVGVLNAGTNITGTNGGICGVKWSKDTEVDISGSAGSGLCEAKKVPRTTYDVLVTEGNKLSLGNDADSTTDVSDQENKVTVSYTKE